MAMYNGSHSSPDMCTVVHACTCVYLKMCVNYVVLEIGAAGARLSQGMT
jgi:hypothetical protein